MKFLGFPHHQQFILMLLGPLFNQTPDPGGQMTIKDVQGSVWISLLGNRYSEHGNVADYARQSTY